MRYVCLIYDEEKKFATMSKADFDALMGEYFAFTKDIRQSGHYLGGNEAVMGDTTFQLASCSKAYTAASVAILVDRGELNWDDPVRRHLPEFQMHDERLSDIATLRDLLSMRLGYKN